MTTRGKHYFPGEHHDSVGLLSAYSLDLVTRTLLPRTVKEIQLGKGHHLSSFCPFNVDQFKFHKVLRVCVEMMTSARVR